MAHSPDMKTQVELFVLRSRARTADIQRRSSSNQTMYAEEQHEGLIREQSTKQALLRDGPQQAFDLIQLKIVSQARQMALYKIAEGMNIDEVLENERANLNADADFAEKNKQWMESACFHKTMSTTPVKGVTTKYPPLLLQTNILTKRGSDQIKEMIKNDIFLDHAYWSPTMSVHGKLSAQMVRNRDVTVQYAQEIWKEQVAYLRTIKSLAATLGGETGEKMLENFDQAVQQSYDALIVSENVPDAMINMFSQVSKNAPYISHASTMSAKP